MSVVESRLGRAWQALVKPCFVYGKDVYDQHRLSFSQEGEDLILARLLEGTQTGYYVDVGAHHPARYSNTYLLYLQGWTGLNIDPLPGAKQQFERLRPRDRMVECAIGERRSVLTYYRFEEPAYNTFDATRVASVPSLLIAEQPVDAYPLAEVLDRHLPPGQAIDVLTVDVEGLDEVVLRSGDWQRHRPRYVLAEVFGVRSLSAALDSPLAGYMASVGYQPIARTVNTLFFERIQ